MPVPEFQSVMLPLLKLASDGKKRKISDAVDVLAEEFDLTEEEIKEMLPSGADERFRNRVYWARTYLKHAGLLEYPDRGYYKITARGKKLLAENPDEITISLLERYDEFLRFRKGKKTNAGERQSKDINEITPEEQLESGYSELRERLIEEIIDKIKSGSPRFFERMVIDLLLKMGYGGSRKDAGEAIGAPRDGGIDGIIKEDKLGLDVIYVQAKRWDQKVSRPQIQAFAGSLEGARAHRGIFITTSDFSADAYAYVDMIEKKIVLIDGNMLAGLMIDHGLGVSTVASYEVKRIDTDYFVEE